MNKDEAIVSTSMTDMLKVIDRTYKAAYKAAIELENLRCVATLETKAEEASNVGKTELATTYIVAAELIRIRE